MISRAYYVFDSFLGFVKGSNCPNCLHGGNPTVASKLGGVGSIRRCGNCGLLYRPMGLRSSRCSTLYYRFLYGKQGIATKPERASVSEAVGLSIKAGKDRAALMRATLPPGRVAVVGASWGYEVLQLQELGWSAFGIEPNGQRRHIGLSHYRLDMYPSIEAAATAGESDIQSIFSSHTLEHIARLDDYLDEIESSFRATMQVHVTPMTIDRGKVRRNMVGQHHPIGLTAEYWARRCKRTGFCYRLWEHQPPGTESPCELVCVLARQRQADRLASLSLPLSREVFSRT